MRNGFILGELIGPPECPLMKRWMLNTPIGSVRLHHFLRDDDERDPHNHPWWFATLVLRGGYTDCKYDQAFDDDPNNYGVAPSDQGRVLETDVLRAGSLRLRTAEHTHWVRQVKPGCLTLVVTGPQRHDWGFWDRGIFRSAKDWFNRYGYAPCQED